jgi:hypothetical protein
VQATEEGALEINIQKTEIHLRGSSRSVGAHCITTPTMLTSKSQSSRCLVLLVIQLCIGLALCFQTSILKRKSAHNIAPLQSVTPKSPIDNRSDCLQQSLRGLLLPASCIAATAIASMSSEVVWAKDDENFDPIVQGILDFSDTVVAPVTGDNFLIQVFDKSKTDSSDLLAGAKLPFSSSVSIPFRFQLFRENLMIPEQKWNDFGEFDQKVVVSLCRGPIEKGGVCRGKVVAKGEGISKVVRIGSESTEIRAIRLFSFVKLKSTE